MYEHMRWFILEVCATFKTSVCQDQVVSTHLLKHSWVYYRNNTVVWTVCEIRVCTRDWGFVCVAKDWSFHICVCVAGDDACSLWSLKDRVCVTQVCVCLLHKHACLSQYWIGTVSFWNSFSDLLSGMCVHQKQVSTVSRVRLYRII